MYFIDLMKNITHEKETGFVLHWAHEEHYWSSVKKVDNKI